jgi:hypothetical protein
MTYAFLRFIEKWLDQGRFPKEELRARWWILGLGAVVLASLAAAVVAVGG